MRSCTQGTQLKILKWAIWEKDLKKNRCMYMYNCFTLLYNLSQYDIANQLYSNKIKKKITGRHWFLPSRILNPRRKYTHRAIKSNQNCYVHTDLTTSSRPVGLESLLKLFALLCTKPTPRHPRSQR